ncbi:PhoPQ-activated protein PqaA family protein [Haloferula rosea]|uniref:PhoPQ-activated pathogenicity-related protein n=1 Tax=Haloferula rosea TaxID=490093 RepID=A0A934VHC8_9BACT|nr:PhoPQ-activated protein PqaA family protein [Haloferula rosea]MBK1828931.1 hypothetical protein [Haloferula rosea]
MNPWTSAFGRRIARVMGVLLLGIVMTVRSDASVATALDTFVYADDPTSDHRVIGVDDKFLYKRYDLELTSGSWRTAEEVDRVLWKHWVSIYVPDRIQTSTALLVISGGSNASTPAFGELDDSIGPVSIVTGSVIVDVGQIPNQPIQFAGENDPRTEDALIAHSWRKFLDDPSDTTWPAQLPMTRAAVKAMDLVQDFLALIEPSDPIDDFIVAGASKRGWTTWLAAAAENGPLGQGRVSAIIPMVIDTLNLEESFDHHFNVYGFWAPAVGDYVDAGVMDFRGTPEASELYAIVDPYAYRSRLTMPKVILNSTGDQFFLPDSSKLYLDGLPGDTWLRYYPNTDHSLSQLSNPLAEILPLYGILLDKGSSAVPDHSWSVLEDGTLELQTSVTGATVKLWQATNPSARDFRLETIGAAFTSTAVANEGGVFRANVSPPESGWTAYFLELSFLDGTSATTGVQVVTKSTDPELRIASTESGIELSFNSKRGEYYELLAGESLGDMSVVESIVPTADLTTWLDPTPEEPRKFYRLRVVTP